MVIDMSEAVRDCFPGSPEDCLQCPGLTIAASNSMDHLNPLDMIGRLTVDTDDIPRNGRGISLATVAGVLGVTVAEVTHAHRRSVGNVGWLLYSGCSGTMQSQEFKPPKRLPWLLPRLRGKVVITIWCGSSSPVADFVAGSSTEEPAWRYCTAMKAGDKPAA